MIRITEQQLRQIIREQILENIGYRFENMSAYLGSSRLARHKTGNMCYQCGVNNHSKCLGGGCKCGRCNHDDSEVLDKAGQQGKHMYDEGKRFASGAHRESESTGGLDKYSVAELKSLWAVAKMLGQADGHTKDEIQKEIQKRNSRIHESGTVDIPVGHLTLKLPPNKYYEKYKDKGYIYQKKNGGTWEPYSREEIENLLNNDKALYQDAKSSMKADDPRIKRLLARIQNAEQVLNDYGKIIKEGWSSAKFDEADQQKEVPAARDAEGKPIRKMDTVIEKTWNPTKRQYIWSPTKYRVRKIYSDKIIVSDRNELVVLKPSETKRVGIEHLQEVDSDWHDQGIRPGNEYLAQTQKNESDNICPYCRGSGDDGHCEFCGGTGRNPTNESTDVEQKDTMRIQDIMRKAAGNQWKAAQLATQMANSIGGYEKAIRRAKAAKQEGEFEMAKIFMKRAKQLLHEGVDVFSRHPGVGDSGSAITMRPDQSELQEDGDFEIHKNATLKRFSLGQGGAYYEEMSPQDFKKHKKMYSREIGPFDYVWQRSRTEH